MGYLSDVVDYRGDIARATSGTIFFKQKKTISPVRCTQFVATCTTHQAFLNSRKKGFGESDFNKMYYHEFRY